MSHIDKLISIVIPVFNRETLILETLRSAQKQTYPNIEIVIVDNKSTDNTWGLLTTEAEKDQRIRLFQNESNVGPVRNWEKCFNYAKGEYIKILWSDDLIEPTFIEETMEVFEENVAFVMTGINIFTDNNKTIHRSSFQSDTSVLIEDYLSDILTNDTSGFPLSPGCAIFRKKDLIKNLLIEIPNNDNLWFKNFGAGNDLLLYLLTAMQKPYTRIAIINQYLSKFRSHKNSITTEESGTIKIYYDWSKWYFIKNHYDKKTIQSEFKSLIYWSYRKNRTTNLYEAISGPISLLYFIKKIIKKYKTI